MPDTEFSIHPTPNARRIAAERFGLHHGQFFAENLYNNLFWVLDGETIGYGDIRMQDLAQILNNLKAGEVFEGFNEHHGSEFQQTEHAMIKVTDGVISFPNHESRGLIAHRRGDRYIFEKRENADA